MYSQSASAESPHGPVYYSCELFFAAAGALCFVFGTFAFDRAPLWLRLSRAAVALVFLLGAAQASERLWRPWAALERSRSLSDTARRIMRVSRTIARGAGLLGILLTAAVARDSRGDLFIASLTLLILGHCLADLAGETFRRQRV